MRWSIQRVEFGDQPIPLVPLCVPQPSTQIAGVVVGRAEMEKWSRFFAPDATPGPARRVMFPTREEPLVDAGSRLFLAKREDPGPTWRHALGLILLRDLNSVSLAIIGQQNPTARRADEPSGNSSL